MMMRIIIIINTIIELCHRKGFFECGKRRPRSACASAQSDQGLPCPLKELSVIRTVLNMYNKHVTKSSKVPDQI